MLVLTALRRLVFLKKALRQYARKKLPEKAAFAEFALLLGLTEILFMETPDYAVINSWVEIVKRKADKYVAGFVNAVLRKACADREELKNRDTGEFFTSEFYRILNHAYGKKTVSKMQAAALIEPALDLTVKTDPAGWAQRLGGLLLPTGSVRLSNNGRIAEIEGYESGAWWVQDAAAALPVKCLGDIRGLKVLDMCAAPGGKTAQLINGGAEVISLDISETRLKNCVTIWRACSSRRRRPSAPTARTICRIAKADSSTPFFSMRPALRPEHSVGTRNSYISKPSPMSRNKPSCKKNCSTPFRPRSSREAFSFTAFAQSPKPKAKNS